MRIISFIEDESVVKKILRHLDLWDTRNHDPPVFALITIIFGQSGERSPLFTA